ncbi:Hint domain-containing protein [Celeribacter halophilus]|uniref:Hint domain-containing protein n=2 Tax=Celeribacter halophilus TaxID=576117 RepID=UPI000AD47756|nr:Hint domain-containing protein [Celeribacter halophilus]
MPSYTIDIIGVTGTAWGTFTSQGVVGTITFSDEDALGVGDNNPDTETGALPTITAVTGSLPDEWVGQTLAFGWQQQIDGSGSVDALGMVIGGDSNFVSTHLVQYPGGTPIITGKTYTASGIENVPNEIVVCFVHGTLIETRDGHVPVEHLKIGDMVLTQDRGYQKIRWAGSFKAGPIKLLQNPKLRPVRIMAGALGNGLPKRDLLVSRQHRVFVRSIIAQRIFGSMEVLIPAIKLTMLPGIHVDESVTDVQYFHFLLDQHEVVFSEGAPTESLYTGPEALKSVPPAARQEILLLFPELENMSYRTKPARHIPEKGKQMEQLIRRHIANERPLLSD